MKLRSFFPTSRPRRPAHAELAVGLCVAGLMAPAAAATFPNYPVTDAQRSTAQQVAEAGVPLSDLAPDAPDSYTIKRGDTLWDISKLFLRTPWRWPELWGMNKQDISNPHLIYPGQLLVLVKSGGRARLQFGQSLGPKGTVRLSPQARASGLDAGPLAGIPLHLIQPFLTDAVVLDTNELDSAPRIVAGLDGRVLLGRGDTAYVRGDLVERRDWRVFRQPRPLTDPETKEVLGYEAAFVGSAQYARHGAERTGPDGERSIVPATFTLNSLRQEANIGDRLMPTPAADNVAYAPHAPAKAIAGRIISIYGEGLTAGLNQIVALNRGKRDGMERGHVFALLRAGEQLRDRTSADRATLQLPDERQGHLFVFQVFERVSYALIVATQGPVRAGDRFIQP
ncbi:MAG: LysM peptidoglycan-binding domain-containing protein [Burkholderiales bacterium]